MERGMIRHGRKERGESSEGMGVEEKKWKELEERKRGWENEGLEGNGKGKKGQKKSRYGRR